MVTILPCHKLLGQPARQEMDCPVYIAIAYTVQVNGLNKWDKNDVPAWCYITERGWVDTPSDNRIMIPRDAFRSLDIFWDGFWCRADYFVWNYGTIYRYCGQKLPDCRSIWRKEHYLPRIELEVQIINLAGTGMEFSSLEKQVRRPRMEIAAIMDEHGYNGWACSLHRGVRTRLLEPDDR